MLRTTAGSLAVNQALPEDLRDYSQIVDAKRLAAILQAVADKHPAEYRTIAKQLSDIGRDTSYFTGGFSIGLGDLREARAMTKARAELKTAITRIQASKSLSPDERNRRVTDLLSTHQERLQKEILEESITDKNPMAMQVLSGSRGKPMNLKALRGADLLYEDQNNNPIPIPILNSYSKGLSPAEFFAGSFGARKGVIDTKMSVQNAGAFGKVLSQLAHRLVVTARDDPDPGRLHGRGLPVSTDDGDNVGALLAIASGGYARNTVLTSKVLADLRDHGIKQIAVRSPAVSGGADGGLYAKDLGIRERGGLSPVGDFVGIAAANAIGEPISQSSLSSKHSGGVAGASRAVSGFKAINQLVNAPKESPFWATHAQVDGRVAAIKPAPAGGVFLTVNGHDHYLPQDATSKVAVGDLVEAGDALSDGMENPIEVVKHKGIGEGRRRFVDNFRTVLSDSGLGAHRRNLEVLSRGLINHVHLIEEQGDHLPGDIIPYDTLEANWTPRDGAREVATHSAAGKYLERPALHYTIGTRVTPKSIKELTDFGIKNLVVHDDPPPFEPHFVRGIDVLQHDPDWLTKMLGANLHKGLLRSLYTGAVSDEHGTSFVPSLARSVEFGRKGPTKGFDPGSVIAVPASGGVL